MANINVCLKCNYCYSCHPKIEIIAKEGQVKKLIEYYYGYNNQEGARKQ